jgi:hypothetical protein
MGPLVSVTYSGLTQSVFILHNTAECRAIAKFKQQKKACFEAKAGPEKKSLAFLFLFKDINELKRQFKPENTQWKG